MSELTVVDADDALVDVVSHDELIRVCLPEYITWVDDLPPILNFEPFAEVLVREADAPVLEIMVLAENCLIVTEETPAVRNEPATMLVLTIFGPGALTTA